MISNTPTKKEMKALSIKQPWAWAICNLPDAFKKDIENRTWNTKYRGEFLVHASKGFDDAGYDRMSGICMNLDTQVRSQLKKSLSMVQSWEKLN